MVLFSGIVSYIGLIVAWVGVWISTNPLAALVIIGSSFVLFGGSAIAGLRRRRTGGSQVTREEAQQAYDRLRSAYLWNRLATPVICVLILIYVDSTQGRWLVVGGLLLSVLASVPAERETLAHLRSQAESARST